VANGFIDSTQCLISTKRVIGKYQIEVDRQARYVAYEEVDGRAALECEHAAVENNGRHLEQ